MRLAGGQIAEHVTSTGTVARSGSRTLGCTWRGSSPPRRRATAAAGWPCPSPRRRASRGRIACRTRVAGRRVCMLLRPVARAVGREGLVDQEDLAGLQLAAELELGVGEDQARETRHTRRPRSIEGEAHVTQEYCASSSPIASGHRLERDVLVVPGFGLGGRREDRLREPVGLDQAAGQGGAADGPGLAILAPAAAGEVAPDDALEGDRPRISGRSSPGRRAGRGPRESRSRPASSMLVEIRWWRRQAG